MLKIISQKKKKKISNFKIMQYANFENSFDGNFVIFLNITSIFQYSKINIIKYTIYFIIQSSKSCIKYF